MTASNKNRPIASSEDDARELTRMAFCQQKFYTRASWAKSVRIMNEVAIPNGLAVAFDYGRGKGKYSTELALDDAVNKIVRKMIETGLVAGV